VRAGWAAPADEVELIAKSLALAVFNRPPLRRSRITLTVLDEAGQDNTATTVDQNFSDVVGVIRETGQDNTAATVDQNFSDVVGVIRETSRGPSVSDLTDTVPGYLGDDRAALDRMWLYGHWLAALLLIAHWLTARLGPLRHTGESVPRAAETPHYRSDHLIDMAYLPAGGPDCSARRDTPQVDIEPDDDYCASNYRVWEPACDVEREEQVDATLIGASWN
jgi:hypothetical protein